MTISNIAKRRWTEISGAKVPARPAASVKVLLTGLANLRLPAAPNPEIILFARRVEGTGCEKQAEIAGWYSKKLAPGQACIGEAAVKAILDAAAAQYCCDTLKCPKKCPCEYIPRPKLGLYKCGNGVEEGFLLQGEPAWNCVCRIIV